MKRIALALALLTTPIYAADWRDAVKIWKVEPFFGEYVVVPDDSFAFCYKSKWRWLAVREAKKLAAQHGGKVVVSSFR